MNFFLTLKKKEIIFDLLGLLAIWSCVFIAPEEFSFWHVKVSKLLKLAALIATLEFFGFIAANLVGEQKGILLKGLFGGFISSTAIFLQFQSERKYRQIDPIHLAMALLLAVAAMLFECIFVVLTLTNNFELKLFWPITVQLICVLITIVILGIKRKKNEEEKVVISDETINDPIIWKRVFYTTLAIVGLIFATKTLSTSLNFPKEMSYFFVSLFEVHGALAGVTLSDSEVNQTASQVVVILAGNTVSKAILLYRGTNIKLKWPVIFPLILSVIGSFFAIKLF